MMRILEFLTRWVPRPDINTDEARTALERAHEAKAAAECRWPEVNEARAVTGNLKRQNHFIDGFKSTL